MIRDLGPDFRKRKGVVLYSGCSSCCCCCCIHTLVSGFFFARAMVRAGKEDSMFRLHVSTQTGMLAGPILCSIGILHLAYDRGFRSDPMTVGFWTIMFLGPIVFPALALTSWLGGAIPIALREFLVGEAGEEWRSLNAVFSHFMEAFVKSLFWIIGIIFLLLLMFNR